jgi:hypothetical protein
MADEENAGPSEEEAEVTPCAQIRMELVDTLPGGRAVIGVEQEDEFVWLASKEHVTKQAVDEFVELMTKIADESWWVQHWPGR